MGFPRLYLFIEVTARVQQLNWLRPSTTQTPLRGDTRQVTGYVFHRQTTQNWIQQYFFNSTHKIEEITNNNLTRPE